MIDEFFILRRDGLSLFHIRIDEDSFAVELPTELFAGFSSAIVAFTTELGAGHLSKIEIEDQIFVYEVKEDLITCTKISHDDDEVMAEHVVAILYQEFIKMFDDELKRYDGTVRRDVFFPFAEKVKEIIARCEKIAITNPHLLANIPASIDIKLIEQLSDVSDEMVNNFPDATIRSIKHFQNKIPKDVMNYTMFRLGKEVGKDIAAKNLKKIDSKNVMKLLNEISVSNIKEDIITLQICPICRGVEAEEFYCDFISGFIEGVYNNPGISVREISCHAVGDRNCKFQIFREK